MRQTSFGDYIVEATTDNLGLVSPLLEADPDEIYAVVQADPETGKFHFDVMSNDDGESLVTSEPIFETSAAAAAFILAYVNDIQYE